MSSTSTFEYVPGHGWYILSNCFPRGRFCINRLQQMRNTHTPGRALSQQKRSSNESRKRLLVGRIRCRKQHLQNLSSARFFGCWVNRIKHPLAPSTSSLLQAPFGPTPRTTHRSRSRHAHRRRGHCHKKRYTGVGQGAQG